MPQRGQDARVRQASPGALCCSTASSAEARQVGHRRKAKRGVSQSLCGCAREGHSQLQTLRLQQGASQPTEGTFPRCTRRGGSKAVPVGLSEEEGRVRAVAEVVSELLRAVKEGRDVDLNQLKCDVSRKYNISR